MKYRIERAKYKDGIKSPFWLIVIYKNGIRIGESYQYSSLLYTIKEWIRVLIF